MTPDDILGMAWWNALSEKERAKWSAIAGNTGRPKDAWEAFKRGSADQPPPVDDARRRFLAVAAGASVASVGALAVAAMPAARKMCWSTCPGAMISRQWSWTPNTRPKWLSSGCSTQASRPSRSREARHEEAPASAVAAFPPDRKAPGTRTPTDRDVRANRAVADVAGVATADLSFSGGG